MVLDSGNMWIPQEYITAFKLALLILVTVDLLVILRSKRKGKILLSYKTSATQELQRNRTGLMVFFLALLLLLMCDWGRAPPAVIVLDMIILAALVAFLVIPRPVVITDRGLTTSGFFHPWEKFASYRINRRLKVVSLKQARRLPFQEPLSFPLGKERKLERILRKKLTEDQKLR